MTTTIDLPDLPGLPAFCEVEFEDDLGWLMATFHIEYIVYMRLGKPTIHVRWFEITSLSGATYDKTRDELIDSGWANTLNQAAYDATDKPLLHKFLLDCYHGSRRERKKSVIKVMALATQLKEEVN